MNWGEIMINKVFFDITKYCNASCVYCFTDSIKFGSDSINEMSCYNIKNMIDELVDCGVKNLSIGGGEPFLRDVCDIADYIGTRLKLSITTNGTILNEKIIDCLVRNNIKVTVSIDTLNQEISELCRKGISVKTVQNNIRLLLREPKIRENLSVRTTVSKYNIDCLFDIVDFCEENNIKEMKINSVNNFGRAKLASLTPDFEYFMVTLDKIVCYCKAENVTTKISLPIEKYLNGEKRDCSLGNESLYIDSRGDVYPCAFCEGNLYLGNVMEEKFCDIIAKKWSHSNKVCKVCPIHRYETYSPLTV